MYLALCALIPLVSGAVLPYLKFKSKLHRMVFVEAATVITSVCVFLALAFSGSETFECFRLTDSYVCAFFVDGASRVYIGLAALLWPFAALYAIEYMAHVEREGFFFTFYTMAYGVTILFAAAANLFTMYVFFEFLTLITLPLVEHGQDKMSFRAARSYLIYLMGGASVAFAGIVCVTELGAGDFVLGGTLTGGTGASVIAGIAFLCMFIGFGAKSAVFPLSRWLPKASVAPTPVTALLHAVAVVNAGVYAVIRVIYYVYGSAYLSGEIYQSIAMAISSFTVLYASLRAVREHNIKRRLAWSTVSNLSYMLFAASLMTADGMAASLAHMLFHGIMKITLFFCAGAILTQTGLTEVSETRGLAKKMPIVFFAFTFAGMALCGVPPLCGFLGKYMIITAAIDLGGVLPVIGSCCVIASSVLTAVYVFTIAAPAYFSTPVQAVEGGDPGLPMRVCFIGVCALIVLASIFGGYVTDALSALAGG